MTPADEIRQATAKLREMAGAAVAPSDEWYEDVESFTEILRREFPSDTKASEAAALIALMDPSLALLVAEWLMTIVNDPYASIGASNDDPHPVVASALVLARHINGRTA